MVAKAGLGLIGLSAISIGGVAISKPHWLGMDYMPSFHFLSEDQSSAGSDSSGKFGDKYKNYLVGVTNKNNGQPHETNQSWWEWAYRRLSKDKDNSTSKKFKKGEKVKEGFIATGDTSKSLHKICEEAYKRETTALKKDADTPGENEFKKSEVWKYCSPGLLTHTKEDKEKYTEQKIGGKNGNKDTLVSVKDSSNDWFWNQRNKDFWADSGDWSGSSGTSGSNNDGSLFKKEYDSKKTDPKKPTIKELCKQAYDGEATNDETDAKKFCVLEVATQ